MLTELKQLTSFPDIQPGRLPHLPVIDTLELIDHIPDGRWEIPNEPYTFWGRIDEKDLDFMKDYKRESFRKQCEEIVGEWIPFLDRAEKGYRIAVRVIEEGVLRCDLGSIEAFNLFCEAFSPKFVQDKKFNEEKTISSVRNAFLYLLPKGKVEELGHEKPEAVDEEGIENARFFVNRLSIMF